MQQAPVPEFMWCQRSDRVYVTIKVADCAETRVDVTADHRLEFRGRGSGMCGQREYALSIQLAKPVTKAECRWFVCGPSVRVRLEKMEGGPYWASLLPKGVKMVQCKVDWQSWLDEDEESEVSAAPNGFDLDELQMRMLSEEDEFYKDPDHLSTSESEGEEENSIQLDDGMNDIAHVQGKFKAFDEEKAVRERTKRERRELRERTREAQRFAALHERDVRFGRPTRALTADEEELIAGASTLRARLKAERAAEKAHFQAQWWHQRRPDTKQTAALTRVMLEAATAEAEGARGRGALSERAGRTAAKLAAYEAARRAAVDIVGHEPKSAQTLRDMARAAATDAVGRAAGRIAGDAEPEWPPLKLPEPKEAEAEAGEREEGEGARSNARAEASAAAAAAAAVATAEWRASNPKLSASSAPPADEDGPSLEVNAEPEEGEEDDGPALEDNGAAEDESEDDEITLEDNSAGVATGAEPGVLL